MQCGGETLGCLLTLGGELKPHREGTGEQSAGGIHRRALQVEGTSPWTENGLEVHAWP